MLQEAVGMQVMFWCRLLSQCCVIFYMDKIIIEKSSVRKVPISFCQIVLDLDGHFCRWPVIVNL